MTIFISANISAYTCTTFEGRRWIGIQEYPQLVECFLIGDVSLKVTLSISFDWVTFSFYLPPLFPGLSTELAVFSADLVVGDEEMRMDGVGFYIKLDLAGSISPMVQV